MGILYCQLYFWKIPHQSKPLHFGKILSLKGNSANKNSWKPVDERFRAIKDIKEPLDLD